MYIEGLNREPENVPEHQALYDVSLRRKIKGGKAAGGLFGAKGPYKGKTAKEQMLNAEWMLAKDPGNISHMQALLRNAAAAEYADVIRWFSPLLLLANRAKPRKEIYIELADIYEKIHEYNKASEAIQAAIELSPTEMELISRAKDLAAKETLRKGQYEKGDDFQQSLRDREGTKNLLEGENLAKSEDYRLRLVAQAKIDYEKNPKDHQLISKYAKTLWDMDEEGYENQAIEVLQRAYQETKTYRYKAYIGDIRMKQYKRNIRLLKDAAKSDPSDKALQQQLLAVAKERLAFELEEYKERVFHYPTDMLFQYEYGLRLYQTKRLDEAIAALQIAQNNPKHRADALFCLGMAFNEKGMKPEAIDTLRRAVESYELADTGDQKTKEIHYWLARALEDTGERAGAVAMYSKITQWDYNFRDVRTRLEALRKATV
jgi:tetratricopeptide (TPR) repeat protein